MSKGGGASAKHQKAVDAQNDYNDEMHSWQWGQAQDNYAYQQENIALQKMNDIALRNYQDQTNFNGWLNRENMRMYEYDNQITAYNASVDSYTRQLDYNDIAEEIALADENRVFQDQLIGFGFQNQDLLMKYFHAGEQASLDTKGLTTKIHQAQDLSDLQIRETKQNKAWAEAQAALDKAGLRDSLAAVKAESAFKSQTARVGYLGAEGKQRNLGQAGRSAGKAIQALLATHGANEAAMADSISKAESKYMLDARKIAEGLGNTAVMTNIKYKEIENTLRHTRDDAKQQQEQYGLKFSQLKDSTDFNRLQLQQSMISAGEQHKANQTKILMDKYQQDINAASQLMTRPTLPPIELAPIEVPETQFQDPLKPNEPPEPAEAINTYQGPTFLQQVGQVASIAGSIATMFPGSDLELKENIVRKGRSKRGFPIYEFNYKHEPNQRYQGVMGQDLLKLLPSAVHEADNGYLAVDYSQLDVEFKKV
tara:strand:- start:1613 stop:3055 length:1443 start_codon:yes stop_codon:yes gene_type:complete